MPDITLCRGEGCPLKDKCLRHTSTPFVPQSWFMHVPYDHDSESCDAYWPIEVKKAKEK